MIYSSFWAFVDRIVGQQVLESDDLNVLRRELLADGLTTRKEAEGLLAIDRALFGFNTAWTDYVVGAVVEFVVWGSRPTGHVDRETARWLTGLLSISPSETSRLIAREVVREAQFVDDLMLRFALRGLGTSRRRVPVASLHPELLAA